MKLKEAIKHCKNNLDKWKKDRPDLSNSEIVEEIDQDYKVIETVLNHLTKQEKMIEYMVNWINDNEDPFEGCHENGKCKNELIPCKECIKQYFERKAEENV